MKLDVRKTFDSMEWPFILATVERAGMNGMLSSFLKANFGSALSTVILNGRPTTPFKLTRSVRQGCPLSPLSRIQRLIELFVWNGRSRVNRKTSTQCKITGGLGLIVIIEQYRAIAGNLVIWTLGQETHPLRLILCAHLQEMSRRKWGFEDFSWLVSPGGSKRARGSAVWRNICLAWSSLKPFLTNVAPRNQEEWGHLPLWSPHKNRILPTAVRCNTQAQHRLRLGGLQMMGDTRGDIQTPGGQLLPWHQVIRDTNDRAGHRAYESLCGNLRAAPLFLPSTES